jgi:hypothetical protein
MEFSKVNEHLKYVTQAGVTLSCEERMQLEYALSVLQSSMQFETLYLWGKINGKYMSFDAVTANLSVSRFAKELKLTTTSPWVRTP